MTHDQPTITPNELRNATFAKALRGFDPVAVTAFLEAVADEMEKLITAAASAGRKVGDQESALAEFGQMEAAIKDTLVAAEKNATERRELAEKEARLIVEEAHTKARRVFEDAEERASDLRRQVDELVALKSRFSSQIEALLSSQLEHLETLKRHLATDAETPAPVHDSAPMADGQPPPPPPPPVGSHEG